MRVEWKVTRKGIWPWWTKENTNCLPSEATFFFSDFLAGYLTRCFFCNKHLYNCDGDGVAGGGGVICSSLMPHLKRQPPNLKNWGVSSRNCCLQNWHCWSTVALDREKNPIWISQCNWQAIPNYEEPGYWRQTDPGLIPGSYNLPTVSL